MWAHGAGIGLSTIPLLWCGVPWYLITIYTVLLSVSMGITRHVLKIDNKLQELIKGFLIIILLLISRR
jgi:ribose/xylose/arabinose/galactoside ABC-type transport system permease subunit